LNPLVLFNIGWAAIYLKEPKATLVYFRASLASLLPHDDLICMVFALLTQAYQMLGDPDSALAVCFDGRSFASDDAGLLFSEGCSGAAGVTSRGPRLAGAGSWNMSGRRRSRS
jgi:hypothetical protein